MKLTLLGLPLGNIQDISYRAVDTLSKADLIICEDTRVFHKLWEKLTNLGYLTHPYQGVLRVVNDFNEKARSLLLLGDIQNANNAVLVSDAGMPTFSDPGFSLINLLLENEGQLEVIPGPTAATTAVAVSGFSSDRVFFTGFLPLKQSKRHKVYQGLKTTAADFGLTVVIYEAPNRMLKTIAELLDVFGDVPAFIAKELTKTRQELKRGPISTLTKLPASFFRGEFVLLIRL